MNATTDSLFAEWIAAHAVNFSIDQPGQLAVAIDRLVSALDPQMEILALGEALHGGEEILQLRNRMFQHLVEHHGYRAIALESSFTRGPRVNKFIMGRGDSDYAAIEEVGFGHGFGKVAANRALIEWMRDNNAGLAPDQHVHFYGFDMPSGSGGPISPREIFDLIFGYLRQVEADAAAALAPRIDGYLGDDANWQNPMLWRDPTSAAPLLVALGELRLATEDLISLLEARRPEMAARPGPETEAYYDALEYARVARQTLTFFDVMARTPTYGASLAVRDSLMADNLLHIARRERPRGKVLVFAHNMHVQRGQAHWQMGPMTNTWWPAGAHLQSHFGARYAVVGTAVVFSPENGIAEPEPGTLEALLSATPGPIRFIPTAAARSLAAQRIPPTRTGSTKNPTYFPLTPESLTHFDALIAFNTQTYPPDARSLA